ncbi:neutral zinc metallopeptidase [Streptosporangiaceae bacterium NEAU-GS5]|nr:neutral zinc metallopeptidase [Streptosporangiaceae bacterium NEAU-GS5]
MDFNDRAQLDPSQVEDVGRGGGGGRGGLMIGGGAAGIITLIIALIFGINPGNITGGSDQPANLQPTSDLSSKCRTGADADQDEKCRVVGVVNSIQDYWGTQIPNYESARTTLFSGAVDTGCGQADSSVGPFYCPNDKHVYLDLGFFDELKSRFGAEGGPFAQAYVIAHEYGHHAQDLYGTMNKVGQGTGPESGSVRLELQADCFAGVWAKHAYDTKFYATQFTDKDIQEALSAAAAVGDDRIQQQAQGQVDPESFTHGTSAQRTKWFTTGYKQSGDPQQVCDTFSGSI